jgi:hypothetical protein
MCWDLHCRAPRRPGFTHARAMMTCQVSYGLARPICLQLLEEISFGIRGLGLSGGISNFVVERDFMHGPNSDASGTRMVSANNMYLLACLPTQCDGF